MIFWIILWQVINPCALCWRNWGKVDWSYIVDEDSIWTSYFVLLLQINGEESNIEIIPIAVTLSLGMMHCVSQFVLIAFNLVLCDFYIKFNIRMTSILNVNWKSCSIFWPLLTQMNITAICELPSGSI